MRSRIVSICGYGQGRRQCHNSYLSAIWEFWGERKDEVGRRTHIDCRNADSSCSELGVPTLGGVERIPNETLREWVANTSRGESGQWIWALLWPEVGLVTGPYGVNVKCAGMLFEPHRSMAGCGWAEKERSYTGLRGWDAAVAVGKPRTGRSIQKGEVGGRSGWGSGHRGSKVPKGIQQAPRLGVARYWEVLQPVTIRRVSFLRHSWVQWH